MKRILIFLPLICAFINNNEINAQNVAGNNYTQPVNNIDTVIRTDTIVIKEVITRTDIVHRTETVVRYEESSTGEDKIYYPTYSDYSETANGFQNNQNGNVSSSVIIEERSVPTLVEVPVNPEIHLPRYGGDYIWVPDSLNKTVNDLISGRSLSPAPKINSTAEEFDPNEKVIFRGDTLPMVLRSRNLGRYDRGLFNFLFIPKGIWQVGITASYGEFSTEDLEVLDLISDVDFSGRLFAIRPYFSYFLKNNISLGMRLGYTQGKANIGSFKMDIDEDMSFNLHDIMYKSTTYSASILFTQYLGIARRGRFGVFNEVELAFGGGASDFHRPFNGEMRETHTDIFEMGLNFSPGICIYMLDQVSFNLSFGVFGLSLRNEKQTENGEKLGERTTSGANFRFNIFNINFGIAVNI